MTEPARSSVVPLQRQGGGGARCERTELPVQMCAHCMAVPDPHLIPPAADRQTTAWWPGSCVACGGPIRFGDVIGLVEGDWVCRGCHL